MGGVQLAVEIRLQGGTDLAVKGDNDAVVIFWRVFGKPLGGGQHEYAQNDGTEQSQNSQGAFSFPIGGMPNYT